MKRIVIGIVLVLLFSILYFYLYQSGELRSLFQLDLLQLKLQQIGYWGPLLIIMLMAGAIVMSPIPSAPIAIAAGLVYGHNWGTLYILIGAEIGALIAFTVSRLLGYEIMQKKFGDAIKHRFFNSSKHLMAIIFISRLIPFISFDIVSYAAGLTNISYLQFAIATLAGIIPVSFLLAHLGEDLLTNDMTKILSTLFLLGFITLIPFVVGLIKRGRRGIQKN